MFTCSVNADLFRRAMAMQSTEQTRYYLMGVQIEPCVSGGVVMVSTDGRAMIVVRDPNGHCEGSAIVSLTPDTAKALKTRRGADDRTLVVNDGQARVMDGDTVHHIQAQPALIDASFPDWRRVIPSPDKDAPSLPGAFNAALVKQMADALSADSVERSVRLFGEGPLDPHLAFGTDEIDAFGVVMPVRSPIDVRWTSWARDYVISKAAA